MNTVLSLPHARQHPLRLSSGREQLALVQPQQRCKRWCAARAEKDDESAQGGRDSPEKLFLQELQRRGISGAEQADRSSGKTATSQSDPPPQMAAEKIRSQLEESRKLNSEGLEGLLPRAKQLLTLGVTFFLAFAPVILAISLLFSGIFWLYGDHFIHGGRPSYTPIFDPNELLNEPTVDPRIPYY